MPGTFTYTPAANTVPGAGLPTLSTTFRPTDTNYTSGTVTVALEVRKAAPTVTVTGGAFAFTGLPRPAVASARDYRGAALVAPTITYNGSSTAPVAAGGHRRRQLPG